MAILSQGDKGAGVILVQGILHRLGYTITNVDGVFGEETSEAVKQFQASEEINIDGKVGDNTASALISKVWSMGYDDESEDGGMSLS